MAAKTKTYNRLWQIRSRTNLEQKQVARLLGHSNCDQLSRYERGERMPGLRIALKLEIIYRAPISDLFPEQYQKYRSEIAADAARVNKSLHWDEDDARLPDAHICTYGNLLLRKKPSLSEIDAVRQHSILLVRRLGNVINGRDPSV